MAMDGKEVCQTLPEDLVEMIISRMPFPSIFKARCLSKSWHAKFASISPQDDKPKECHAAASSFQKQVGEQSNNWETLCPIKFCGEACFGYSRSSQAWRRMPSLSFIPDEFQYSLELRMEGAFVYLCAPCDSPGHGNLVYVGNILARSWRRLPPCPFTDGCEVLSVNLVTGASLDTYKLILFCPVKVKHAKVADRFDYAQIYVIYDSKSDSWRQTNFGGSDEGHECTSTFCYAEVNSTYFNGAVYTIANFKLAVLWAIHVEEDTLEEIILDTGFYDKLSYGAFMVVSQSDLYIISICGDNQTTLFSVDLESETMSFLSTVQPYDNDVWMDEYYPVSDGSYIYFGMHVNTDRVLAFNLDDFVYKKEECNTLTRTELGSGTFAFRVARTDTDNCRSWFGDKNGWCSVPGPTCAGDDCIFSWFRGSFRPGMGTFTEV